MNEPKLRFNGFIDSWVSVLLSDVSEINPKSSSIPDAFEYVDLESVVGTEIISHRTENRETAPSRAQRVAQIGDIFFQTVRPYQKNNCYFSNNDGKNYVFSTGYAQIRPRADLDGYFLFSALQQERFVNNVLNRCTGTSYPAINSTDLASILIRIPVNRKEQCDIGELFRALDRKISLKQKKYDALVEAKKGLLQKIFSQEIRFKRDDGGEYPEWERLQLGAILDVITDYVAAGSFADIAAHVEYKSDKDYAQLIRTTDLKNNFANSDFVYVTKEAFEYLWRVNLNTECIILPNVGNCGEVYFVSPSMLPYRNNVLGPNAILVKSFKNSNRFLSYMFLSTDFQTKLKLIISPTGQKKFNKTELKGIEIYLPCIDEQQRIADFLSSFDEKIDTVRKELEGWKTIKKGLLQQMFC